jgi:hypothetical protein
MKGRRDEREARGKHDTIVFGRHITVEWRLKTKMKLLSLLFFFSARLYYLVKPQDTALGQPLLQRLPGVGRLKTSKLCR